MWLALVVSALTLLILALSVVALWHHKKSTNRSLNIIGATGLVETPLDPEGAVIINGELWRARTEIGNSLKLRNRVRVVGAESHLLVVMPESDKL